MKRITSLAAIVAAVMALVAAFSAASASAGTVLCEGEANPCPEANIQSSGTIYRVGQIYTPSLEIVSGGSTFVRCNQNVMNMKTTKRIGNPLPAEFESVIVPSYCTTPANSASKCTAASTNSPPTNLVATGVGTGVAEIGSAANPLTLSFTCSGSIGETTCVYKATGTVKLNQQEWATATISAPLTRVSGAFLICGVSNFTLKVNNSVSESKYISSATETVLCKEQYSSVCPDSDIASAGTRFGVGGLTGFTLKNGSTTVTKCNQSMWFDTTRESGAPLPATGDSAIYVASCAGPFSQPCTAASWNKPSASFEATGFSQGVITLGSAGEPLTLTTTCRFTLEQKTQQTCKWTAKGPVKINVDEAGHATIKAEPMVLAAGVGFFACGVALGGEVKLSLEASTGGINGESLFINRI